MAAKLIALIVVIVSLVSKSDAVPAAASKIVGSPVLTGADPGDYTLTTTVGTKVTLTATIAGTMTSHKWFKDASTTAIAGKTTNVLEFASITTGDAGAYTVKGVDGSGDGTASKKVTITVNAAAAGGGAAPTAKATLVGAPALAGTGPWTLSVEEGKAVKLTATVATATEYMWLKDGTAMTEKTKDLTFNKIAKADAAVYTVKGKNAGGEGPVSEKVTITVTEKKDSNGAGTTGISVLLSVVLAFAAYLTK